MKGASNFLKVSFASWVEPDQEEQTPSTTNTPQKIFLSWVTEHVQQHRLPLPPASIPACAWASAGAGESWERSSPAEKGRREDKIWMLESAKNTLHSFILQAANPELFHAWFSTQVENVHAILLKHT